MVKSSQITLLLFLVDISSLLKFFTLIFALLQIFQLRFRFVFVYFWKIIAFLGSVK